MLDVLFFFPQQATIVNVERDSNNKIKYKKSTVKKCTVVSCCAYARRVQIGLKHELQLDSRTIALCEREKKKNNTWEKKGEDYIGNFWKWLSNDSSRTVRIPIHHEDSQGMVPKVEGNWPQASKEPPTICPKKGEEICLSYFALCGHIDWQRYRKVENIALSCLMFLQTLI